MVTTTDPSKIAIVTGAASGVGLETARLLLHRGSCVIGVDTESQPEGLSASSEVLWVKGDVSSASTWESARRLALTQFRNTPGVLVLCAARLVVGTVLETTVQAFRDLFEVNVYGVILGLQACLPDMITRGTGSVVAIASVNGLQGEQRLAAYNSSKGALVQLVRSAAVDHARDGVRVNAICPTSIDTPFISKQAAAMSDKEEFRRKMNARHPLGRILRPEEVASVAVFLTSADASGMTGTCVVVDCGLTASPDFN
jgi:NAD(P)-dependent dehydrogenase (short-subunit alcohol dehydrogenase family)